MDLDRKITILKLDGVRLGYDGIQALARGLGENINLEVLSLVGCYIRAHGASCLSNALYKNRGLAELDLSRNGLKTQGAMNLAASHGIGDNNALIRLNLSDNGIVDASRIAEALKVKSRKRNQINFFRKTEL